MPRTTLRAPGRNRSRPKQNKQADPSATATALPDAAWKQRFRRQVSSWYRRHGRDLPWRRAPDGYRVWISEIMLQQTQVATVEPYFARFLKAFPTIDALAAAEEDAVLRLWEGLGYYRRARQLHQAARIIVDEHDGVFPQEAEAVRRLPGIGRYTAGAILSIAFDAREPIVEANTLRLYSRLLGYTGDPRSSAGNDLLWKAAADWLPRRGAGAFNQALMDLGAEVCLVRQPHCDACPVAGLCRANQQGLQAEIPRKASKPRIEDVRQAAVVVRHRDHVLLRRCAEGEHFAGLWDFVRFEHPGGNRAAGRRLVERVAELVSLEVDSPSHLATIKHAVTRFRITLDCYQADLAEEQPPRLVAAGAPGLTPPASKANLRWATMEALAEVPLSATARKIALLIGAAAPAP